MKVAPSRSESSKTIAEHQIFNGKQEDWIKERRFIEAYLYKKIMCMESQVVYDSNL